MIRNDDVFLGRWSEFYSIHVGTGIVASLDLGVWRHDAFLNLYSQLLQMVLLFIRC